MWLPGSPSNSHLACVRLLPNGTLLALCKKEVEATQINSPALWRDLFLPDLFELEEICMHLSEECPLMKYAGSNETLKRGEWPSRMLWSVFHHCHSAFCQWEYL